MPNIGYGSNQKTKHMMPNGLYKFVISNVKVSLPQLYVCTCVDAHVCVCVCTYVGLGGADDVKSSLCCRDCSQRVITET